MLGSYNTESERSSQMSDPYDDRVPILRIGLLEHRDSIEFRSSGRFSVLNDQGMPILKEVTSTVKWRVKIQQRQPAKYIYNILLGKFHNRQEAQELEYKLIEKGIGTLIKIRGGKLYYSDRIVNDNTQFWVVVDDLVSEQEAEAFANERLTEFSYEIVKQKINEPHAMLELFDSEFEKLGEAENVIRIIPESPNVVTYIYDLTLDPELHCGHSRYCSFQGTLEFRGTADCRMAIICEMPIERYVESVVASQMKTEIPEETLKAQAVVVRSKTIAFLGIKHHDDPYHLCSHPHCQLFAGITKIPENVLKAVRDTEGIVLRNQRQVIDANYSLICGGYTEAYHSIIQNDAEDPYPPIFDGDPQNRIRNRVDLSWDENLKQWIQGEPDVYCNLLNRPFSNSLFYIRNKFRWRLSYDRQELETIISSRLGTSIGMLYDIIPIHRGASGRILELEILGSKRNFVLKGEDHIRNTLATEGLLSSCFVIERQLDEDGFPIVFTIYGAGAGHGIGLCQAGGIAMALQGRNYIDILTHYFRGTDLKKIY